MARVKDKPDKPPGKPPKPGKGFTLTAGTGRFALTIADAVFIEEGPPPVRHYVLKAEPGLFGLKIADLVSTEEPPPVREFLMRVMGGRYDLKGDIADRHVVMMVDTGKLKVNGSTASLIKSGKNRVMAARPATLSLRIADLVTPM